MQRSNCESCWTKPGFRHFAANTLSPVPHHVDHFYNLVKNYHIVSSLTSETIYIVKYRSWTIAVFRLVFFVSFSGSDKGQTLLVSQLPSISSARLCLLMSCSWLTFFGGWWQDLHSGHRETLHSVKPKNTKKTENPLHGSTSCAAGLCRAAPQMMRLGAKPSGPPFLDDKRKSTG